MAQIERDRSATIMLLARSETVSGDTLRAKRRIKRAERVTLMVEEKKLSAVCHEMV